jgi:hypothetical protein
MSLTKAQNPIHMELYWDATEHILNDEEILNQPSTHYPEITYSLHNQISCSTV